MSRNILVTNDDGIDSPGLWALVRAVAPLGDHVYVIAPTVNQSAVGAGITLRRELHWERYTGDQTPGVEAWHVNGTPADCVLVGMSKIVEHDIHWIVSGVNQGANVGNDILASGTVGGALQGHFIGLTSMAFSQTTRDGEETDWSCAERVAALIARAAANGDLPTDVFLNINVPYRTYEELGGVLVTRMGRHGYLKLKEAFENVGVIEREVELMTNPDTPPGTDTWALANGYVSVSPLQSNLTDHRLLDLLSERLNAAFGGPAAG
ncbi:MAG: 5'/3'-nucleotidase SurE [Dehalococcoidia bacterium]|nr:5'/3'-nucleotidase SurE [Dehalococcoidia bacterium]